MFYLYRILLLITPIFCNDGLGPLFTSIPSASDFFEHNSIQIEVQAIDQDGVEEILLYYRFSEKENYKNSIMEFDLNYSIIIPGFEVNSEKIQYYFLGNDKFSNQTQYPEEGESNPFELPILNEINNQKNSNSYEINLINPLENSQTEDVSILILSLYNENNIIIKENINIILDNKDITNDCNISNELITYVPSGKIIDGSHTLILKLTEKDKIYFSRKFYFEVKGSEPISENIINNWIEKINYSGNINYTSDYDKFNYEDKDEVQPDGRPLDIHRVHFNFKVKYKQIDLKSSILFNTHIIDAHARNNKKYKQPIDRIKFGVNIPFGTFNFGDYSTTFSDLTLKGTRVRGLHSSLEVGFFKMIYIRGKTKELIESEQTWINVSNNPDLIGYTLDNGNFIYYKKGSPSRNLRALRTEFNFGKKFNIGFSGLTSYDVDDVDIPFEPLYSNYLFLGNSVIGTDATLFFNNKRTWIKAETAISMTYDLRADPLEEFIIEQPGIEFSDNVIENLNYSIGTLEKITGYYITSDLLLGAGDGRGLSIPIPIMDSSYTVIEDKIDYLKRIFKEGTYKIKFKTPFSLYNTQFNLQGEYKRIPFNFVSFGNPSISKDVQGLSSDLRIKLLNNKIIINLGYDNKNDNVSLFEDALLTTTSIGNNIGFSLNFNSLPTLSYSRKFSDRKDKSGSVHNSTISHMITPVYKFNLRNTKISINTNAVIMDYYDFISGSNNFRQLSLSSSTSISINQLSINIGSGYSNNNPENIERFETSFLAFSSKISYKPKNNRLSSFLGFNQVIGENLDPSNPVKNYRSSIKLGAQYKINQYSDMKYNVEYLSFSDDVDASKSYSEFKVKLSFKINF